MRQFFFLSITLTLLLTTTLESADKKAKPTLILKYSDGKADGKKSIAGNGEMIKFILPEKTQQLKGIQVHCSRYGYPKAPDEDVEITIVSEDESDVIHTEMIPYSSFKRGTARWTTLKFKEPTEVPENFWVIMNFNAEQTKGVYVSFDTSTKGEYSKTGLPGGDSEKVTTGGDWMVQAMLTKPEEK